MPDQEMKEILKMLEEGKITAEEANELLNAIEADEFADGPLVNLTEASPSYTRASDVNLNTISEKIRTFWKIPLAIGILITLVGSFWMLDAMRVDGFGFWFYCAWIPFSLGVLVIVLAVGSKKLRWLFVKIKQASGEKPKNITFGFPLPLRFSVWILRNLGDKIPSMKNVVGVDDILETLADTPIGDTALIVDVHNEDGEEVQVFIG